MIVSFSRTIDVDCKGLPEGMLFPEAVKLLLEYFDRESDHVVEAVQACPGRVARVTFAADVAKLFFEELGVVKLGEVECRVVTPPPPPPQLTTVVLSWFPFEGSNEAIRTALSAFGIVKSVRHQSWSGRPSVFTGSRIIQMVVQKVIPPFIGIRGIRCRVWYRGQPLQCTVCRKIGHKAASCPSKGKCFRCSQQGHFARDCKATVDVPTVTDDVEPSSMPEEPPADSADEACSLSSEASEDRSTSLNEGEELPNDCVPATQGFANPVSDMDVGETTSASRKRSASPAPTSANNTVKRTQQAPPTDSAAAAKPIAVTPSELSAAFLKDPWLSTISSEDRVFLAEIAVLHHLPAPAGKDISVWYSDPRYVFEQREVATAFRLYRSLKKSKEPK